MSDREPVSPDLVRFIEAERARPGLPDDVSRRLLARIDATVVAGGGSSGGLPAPSGQRRPSLGRLPFGAGMFAVGAVVGAALHMASTRRSPVVPVAVATTYPGPAATAATAPPPALAPRDDEPTATKTRPHLEPRTARDAELNAERSLIEVARTALSRGQPEATIEALRKHAQAYRHGRLAEERDSLWILAFVQAELYPEAKRRAEKFRRDYPKSLLLPTVEHALQGIR